MWKLYTHCSSFTLMVCMDCHTSRKNWTIFYRKSFQGKYMFTKTASLFVRENKYHKLTTIYYVLLIRRRSRLPMKELIEFLKELMKSSEAMPRETFCCQSSAFPFHQKPNSNWLLWRNKVALGFEYFFSNIIQTTNRRLIRHVAVENCKTIWKLPFVGIWFRKLVETEIYDGALWCDAY